ncbi:MAG TPA: EAL domain-containing protein [Candidatus Sulfotelmatobacter sp.]|nr:EAL domain-containing protein [Candidatus Sulfotelmatobacter sp.]
MTESYDRAAVAGTTLLVAAAVASIPFGRESLPVLGSLVPTMFFLGAAALFGAAALLFVLSMRSPRRDQAVLTALLAGDSLLTLIAGLIVPAGSSGSSIANVDMRVVTWLNIPWAVGAALGALVYARARNDERPFESDDARRWLGLWVALGVALAALAVAASLAFGDQLPDLTIGAVLRRTAVGPIVAAFCVLAAVVLIRDRVRSVTDLGARLAFVAMTAGFVAWTAEVQRFDGAWYTARAFWLASTVVILVAAFRELQLSQLTPDLAPAIGAAPDDVVRHGRRLEMLWRLAGASGEDDVACLRAMLGEAAHMVREGVRFHGVLARIDDGDLVVEVVTASAVGMDVPAEGTRYALTDTLLADVRRAGTSAWSDIRSEPRFARIARLRAHEWRAFIAAPFEVAGVPYVVSFLSFDPLPSAFTEADRAYVELLSSLCATRMHERVQDDRLRYHSEHDPITGLPNRVSFRARGQQWLRDGRPLAVVVADVDRFRELNDTLGHQVGDTILTHAGAALRNAATDDELVARLGGDSFGILVPGGDDRLELEARLLRFLGAFGTPVPTGVRSEAHVAVTASFGVAVAPADGTDFEQLLSRADTAVFVAKQSGRARWSFFDSRVETEFALARGLRNEIVEALANDEFVLYFQPHVELDSGRVAGAEALIRWNHPVRGFLLPGDFIPFAETHGLAGMIGEWVMRETVRVAQRVRTIDPAFRIWFNLSAEELSDPALLARLRRLDGDLTCVGVEITETAAMRNVDRTVYAIDALRKAGLGIALDDFGTGYSSLSHLRRLQLDLVKIDRSFIAGVPSDTHDIAIVEAVISIAERYGFHTVAEGVETFPQIAFLAAQGCTYGQGFIYARPMSETAFETWLGDRLVRPGAGVGA